MRQVTERAVGLSEGKKLHDREIRDVYRARESVGYVPTLNKLIVPHKRVIGSRYVRFRTVIRQPCPSRIKVIKISKTQIRNLP